jgi:hypothetical protein
MLLKWLLDRIGDHTTKLWGLKLLGDSNPNGKGIMFAWPQLLGERQKLLDGGVGALSKVLEAYMNEVVLLTDPIWRRTTRPLRAQRGGKIVRYTSGCYSVAPARQWSTQYWTFINEGPHLTIGYLLRGVPNACVGGLVTKLWESRSKVWGANDAHVWDVQA